MPRFRRPRNPNTTFKLVAAVFILIFYLLWTFLHSASPDSAKPNPKLRPQIQHEPWRQATHSLADAPKAERVRDAMRFIHKNYRERAWGADDILPVSGAASQNGYGWAGFIVESASTLALMGLWDELAESVDFITTKIDFARSNKLVDLHEATTRYLSGLLSLVDLSNAGLVPENIVSQAQKDSLLRQALVLAQKLEPAYDTPTGMPWPLLDFSANTGHLDPSAPQYEHPAISPSHTATLLENRVLTRLTNDPTYLSNATRAWSHLVWSAYETALPGLPDGLIDIVTGAPIGRGKGWDHAYHSALLKASIFSPGDGPDRYAPIYLTRWHEAAQSVRHALVSRNAPAAEDGYAGAHLFLGRKSDTAYVNEMASGTACAAPGTLLLGARYLAATTATSSNSDADEKGASLAPLALALLEGCHHILSFSAVPGLAPGQWRWIPSPGTWMSRNASFVPEGTEEWGQVSRAGGWVPQESGDGVRALRIGDAGGYVQSLFYAWRVTGQMRYRRWAWEVFEALEERCRAEFGFAGVEIGAGGAGIGAGKAEWIDEAEGSAVREILMWLWLTFSHVKLARLEDWVFSSGGHPFRLGS